MSDSARKDLDKSDEKKADTSKAADCPPLPPREIGGREGLDPTRYGDWEKNGRCIDF